jgi:putative DNA primase/helicase
MNASQQPELELLEDDHMFRFDGLEYLRRSDTFYNLEANVLLECRDPRIEAYIERTLVHDGRLYMKDGGNWFLYAPHDDSGWEECEMPAGVKLRVDHEEPANKGAPKPASPQRFFDAKSFVPSRLGGEVRSLGHVRVGPGGGLYRYVRGVYRPDGEDWAKQQCRFLLGERFKQMHLNETISWLKAEPCSIPAQPDRSVVNCRNGLLDWASGQLRPHSPDEVFLHQIPAEWNPEASCPVIERFLEEALPAQAVPFVHEVFGYALYPGNPFKKAVMLYGTRDTGKGTLLNLLTAFVGAENCSFEPLQSLADNRFRAAELHGKLANVCGDIDARAVQQTDLFKMITGNDMLSVERKYEHPFQFVAYALLVFSANQIPGTADQSEAYLQRWLFLPLDHHVPKGQQDTKLEQKMATDGELSGLLVHCVEGLRRLMDRGRFDPPAAVEEASDEARVSMDNIRRFVEESCQLGDGKVVRKELHGAYKYWCATEHQKPEGSTTFYGLIRDKFKGRVVEHKNSKGIWEFRGISLSL